MGKYSKNDKNNDFWQNDEKLQKMHKIQQKEVSARVEIKPDLYKESMKKEGNSKEIKWICFFCCELCKNSKILENHLNSIYSHFSWLCHLNLNLLKNQTF